MVYNTKVRFQLKLRIFKMFQKSINQINSTLFFITNCRKTYSQPSDSITISTITTYLLPKKKLPNI